MPPNQNTAQMRIASMVAGAALVGALVGGGASYLGARQQVHGQDEQSRSDYWRSQRTVAYSTMLEHDQRINEELIEIMSETAVYEGRPLLEEPRRRLRALQGQVTQLQRDKSNIELIGSARVVTAARILYRAHRKAVQVVDRWITARLGPANEEAEQEANQALYDLGSARSAFVRAVRDALGVEDRTD